MQPIGGVEQEIQPFVGIKGAQEERDTFPLEPQCTPEDFSFLLRYRISLPNHFARVDRIIQNGDMPPWKPRSLDQFCALLRVGKPPIYSSGCPSLESFPQPVRPPALRFAPGPKMRPSARQRQEQHDVIRDQIVFLSSDHQIYATEVSMNRLPAQPAAEQIVGVGTQTAQGISAESPLDSSSGLPLPVSSNRPIPRSLNFVRSSSNSGTR